MGFNDCVTLNITGSWTVLILGYYIEHNISENKSASIFREDFDDTYTAGCIVKGQHVSRMIRSS
jgi:hypothetical protein